MTGAQNVNFAQNFPKIGVLTLHSQILHPRPNIHLQEEDFPRSKNLVGGAFVPLPHRCYDATTHYESKRSAID